ncbi:histidine phosphatase family protein [Ligilactobacillus sp. WILCCON 0076]|uniref:Histidine phosphatase family protein n=1 Tax=Ligilactobacillus ubinensis TaxID=2876789 RepID=A0A9X2FIE0_9LACO|nr:histidine phosphatase family protein [Ligilactobacillus ubinensis]MCP0886472.1 histidine phosphatase family protein [Ligilactobacillus ubinensis]
MTKLYFIRHGKTQWNLERRYQGAKGDSPLLDESFDEIKQLCDFLKTINFVKAYSSPIKRARVTAQTIVAKLDQNIPLEVNDAFREFNLGKMEGVKFSDCERLYPKEVDAFRNHPEKYDASKIAGESFEEVFARMTPKIKAICKRYPNENVLIVSHGAALCAEIRHLMGIPLEQIRAVGGLNNTSTTILTTLDGQNFKCSAWNKHDYLVRALNDSDMV